MRPVCTNFRNSVNPAYTTSEVWWFWVNQVAKEVAKSYPDKWLEALAYGSPGYLPRFPLEKNVTVTKTIVCSSSSGAFRDLKLADDWAKVCKSVNLYSYMWGASFMGFRHYPHAAKDFLKWGHEELGSLAHVTECYGDWTFDGPKYHYIMALQWDVNANPDEIMQDFCAQSYGSAAASMHKFWDRLEEVYEHRGPTPYGEYNPRLLFYQWPSWRDDFYIQPNDEFREYTLADVQFLDDRIKEALSLAKSADAGALADTFNGKSLDQERWFQATDSTGTLPPKPVDGWLIYDDAVMYSITAYAKFNDLLKYSGEKRYCLRLHAASLPNDAKPAAFYWGIKTGTGQVSILDSGMF